MEHLRNPRTLVHLIKFMWSYGEIQSSCGFACALASNCDNNSSHSTNCLDNTSICGVVKENIKHKMDQCASFYCHDWYKKYLYQLFSVSFLFSEKSVEIKTFSPFLSKYKPKRLDLGIVNVTAWNVARITRVELTPETWP